MTRGKLPRGALIEAHDAVARIPGMRPDLARVAARAALEAAMPTIRRSVLREAARQILALTTTGDGEITAGIASGHSWRGQQGGCDCPCHAEAAADPS